MSPEEKIRFITSWTETQIDRHNQAVLDSTSEMMATQFNRGMYESMRRLKLYMEVLDKRTIK